MTGAEIRKCGRRGLAVKYPMSQVSWAYEKGETQVSSKSAPMQKQNKILGAAILGVGGDEVIITDGICYAN
jgi:hypothetical protein